MKDNATAERGEERTLEDEMVWKKKCGGANLGGRWQGSQHSLLKLNRKKIC